MDDWDVLFQYSWYSKQVFFISEVKEKIVTSQTLMAFDGHCHPEMEELLICLKEITGVRIGGSKDVYLSPGQGILLEPGEEHLLWDASTEKNTSFYNAFYKGNLPLFRRYMNIPFEAEGLEIPSFWKEPLADNRPKEENILTIMTLLIALDKKEPDRGKQEWNSLQKNPIRPQTLNQNIREHLLVIIQSDLGKNHTLAELGKKFFLEPKYLSQKVKKITGLPIMTMYYQLKMESACALLSSGASVKDTAYTLGFKNPYHFSRKFKGITGSPPSDFPKSP